MNLIFFNDGHFEYYSVCYVGGHQLKYFPYLGMDKIKSYLYSKRQSNYARFWLLLMKMAAVLNVGHVNIAGHYYKRFH